ncbi:hypothetical protein ACO0RG_002294 [Hanseniaspora osmophila]|uniref:Transcription initiation factor TFIID subunit 1 n=1 Tax=Hanseniaspora osmophila TaxID=56408 RepID=A0A1E5RHR7_9ASCO|nr:Transcription initiation factor TFIID subunit 1 [Hanseniaspora osmophila]
MAKGSDKVKGGSANDDEAFNSMFGGDFGTLNIDSIIQSKSKGTKKDAQGVEGEVQHLPDAIDFEDEDELASEDDLPEETQSSKDKTHRDDSENEDYMNLVADAQILNPGSSPKAVNNNLFDMNEEILETNQHESGLIDHVPQTDFDLLGPSTTQTDSGEANMRHVVFDMNHNGISVYQKSSTDRESEAQKLQRLQDEEKKLIRAYFPSLKRGKILKMTKLLPPKPQQYHWHMPFRALKPLIPNFTFQVQPDTRKLFNSNKNKQTKKDHVICISENDVSNFFTTKELRKEMDEENGTLESVEKQENSGIPEFETDILTQDWDTDQIINGQIRDKNVAASSKTDLVENPEDWDWDANNLIDGHLNEYCKPQINMNDNKLLLLDMSHSKETMPKQSSVLNSKLNKVSKKSKVIKITDALLKSKFNLSNDSSYNILKQNYVTKIRSTISNLTINHSLPAIKLQTPFYKAVLFQEKLRKFHRFPSFSHNIRADATLSFRKLKLRKRKKDRGKEVQEIFQKSTDLTVGDTASVFLMEYSERQPLALSNFGMTSKLINYYRKMSDDDPSRPKLQSGETHVLGVQDKSPFWNFGFVGSGETVQTLYNNMIRAPIYQHNPNSSDFLLVKSTGASQGHRFYLRNINNLFTVGQTLPCVEITGPTSRKINLMSKNRLKMIAYRSLNKSPHNSLTIRDIKRHFPGQTDMHIRLKLKEFMKFHREKERNTDENGSWRLKEGEAQPDFETIRKMISPEDVATQDSTFAAQKFLDDNKLYNIDKNKANLEEQLTPWNTTKNFLNATQMRAMVAIHGEGDPTGNGEGISFLKTSMKGGLTFNSAGGPGTPGTPSAVNGNGSATHSYSVSQQQKMYEDEIKKTWYQQGKSLSISNPYEELPEDPNLPNESNRHVKTTRSDQKVLKIVRKQRDQYGIIHRETVVIKDPRVINGYLKHYEVTEKTLDTDILLGDKAKSFISGSSDEEKTKKLQTLLATKLSEAAKKSGVAAASNTLSGSVPGTPAAASSPAATASAFGNPDGNVGFHPLGATPISAFDTSSVSTQARPSTPGGENSGKITNRKCAACGAVGHIKTNKSCPMYNASKS